jgi:hypothetical protein
MKFDDLFKRAFNLTEDINEVADPQDPAFDDVQGAPVPDLALDAPSTEDAAISPAGGELTGAGNLTDFISKLEEFSTLLNDPGDSSLQSIVSRLDKVETPFDGIKGNTSSDIQQASIILKRISEKLKTFLINAAKAKVS